MAFGSFFLLAVVSVVISIVNAELPASLKTCSKNSNDYSSCLRLAFQENWPTLVRGIPEYKIPVLDPFVTEVEHFNFEMGEVTGKMVVKNVQSYGAAKIQFHSIRPYHSENHFRLDIDFTVPKVLVEGDYKAEGSIGTLRHNGKGQFNVSMENVRSIVQMEGSIVNDRWILDEVLLTPEVGSMKVWASNLFRGNEALTKVALEFVNQYWQVLYQGMLPYAAKSWNESLKKMANDILINIPFSDLFP
ncbi:hypothetical protein HCN44_005723 [Aphidius gifuensis]|uniref:Odorant-binding protein n=1 Tax=Aphidius gifuensis TaxID=684658 RepID=A0A835CR59_APHGI|nr:uncharacterized protein LOC122852767 [Aphidius gifuensis]KAF7992942.1 hypothetical protein HCN44_005723 [Aphidius gifuensis]